MQYAQRSITYVCVFLYLWICTLEDKDYYIECKSLKDNEAIHVDNMNFRVWSVRNLLKEGEIEICPTNILSALIYLVSII